ncbi:hypothetical protein Pint_02867 [Pistacia integerrima]|uniref:Uncharacterized protein n=1 Tax=Pistacia integerrima TaxID=434235 RepID=A0ACC0ZFT3_9ROSI|nr:hypothetical protein Pint_02867 [Pistacia integerrima]
MPAPPHFTAVQSFTNTTTMTTTTIQFQPHSDARTTTFCSSAILYQRHHNKAAGKPARIHSVGGYVNAPWLMVCRSNEMATTTVKVRLL